MKGMTLPMVIILITLSISPLMVLGGSGTNDIEWTRAAGEDREINTTVTLTQNEVFRSLRIRDNGRLIISNARIEVEEFICRQDAKNTSLRITAGSFLTITKGVMSIKADSIRIENSYISVSNETNVLNVGEVGKDSTLTLLSMKEDLVITGSTITVFGQNGVNGDPKTFGSSGGRALMTLEADGENGIQLNESEIRSTGGKGGDNYNPGMRSGPGGETRMAIRGKWVTIDNCPAPDGTTGIRAEGGKAGSATATGNKGGFAQIQIDSDDDVIVRASEVESVYGSSTDQTVEPESRLFVKTRGSFLVDHEKQGAERTMTLSRFWSTTSVVDAGISAELFQVDVGNSHVGKGGAADVEEHWWAKVHVQDVYGYPLGNARVIWYIGSDQQPYPRDSSSYLTDLNGQVSIQVAGFINGNRLSYRFEAEIQGGIKEKSEQIYFQQAANNFGTNREFYINITRIDLQIASVNNDPFVSGMTVGGEIVIEGRAETRSPINRIQSVVLYEGEALLAQAVNTGPEEVPYSSWRITLNTEQYKDGIHRLVLIAKDQLYEVSYGFTFIFDRNAVNHRPLMDTVIIGHARGVTDPIPSRQSAPVFVNNGQSQINLTVEAWESDWRSSIITSGKKVVRAVVSIQDLSGVEFFDKTLTDDDIFKSNETGGFFFKFQVDTSNRKGTDGDDFPEGTYYINITLQDDAGFLSTDTWVKMDLEWDYYPRIDLFIDGVEYTMNDPLFPEPTWNLESEESDTIDVPFNMSRCYDQDSPLYDSGESYKDLTITIEIRLEGSISEVIYGPTAGVARFLYTFDLDEIPDNTEGIYTITVTAQDSEGLRNSRVYKARILHDPPPLPNSVIGEIVSTEDLGIEIGPGIFAYLGLLIIGLLVYIGLYVMNYTKVRRDRAKKLDLIEKMKAEEKKLQAKSAVEDEVRSGKQELKSFMTTPKPGQGPAVPAPMTPKPPVQAPVPTPAPAQAKPPVAPPVAQQPAAAPPTPPAIPPVPAPPAPPKE